jgi:hypothetical protein
MHMHVHAHTYIAGSLHALDMRQYVLKWGNVPLEQTIEGYAIVSTKGKPAL